MTVRRSGLAFVVCENASDHVAIQDGVPVNSAWIVDVTLLVESAKIIEGPTKVTAAVGR